MSKITNVINLSGFSLHGGAFSEFLCNALAMELFKGSLILSRLQKFSMLENTA